LIKSERERKRKREREAERQIKRRRNGRGKGIVGKRRGREMRREKYDLYSVSLENYKVFLVKVNLECSLEYHKAP
jgi:hypothetical protein